MHAEQLHALRVRLCLCVCRFIFYNHTIYVCNLCLAVANKTSKKQLKTHRQKRNLMPNRMREIV